MTQEQQIISGRELIQLGVGVYQVVFAFEGDITLSVESAVRSAIGASKSEWLPEHPESTATLVTLVGQKVTEVKESDEDGLILIFASGATLEVLGRKPYGEAYQITSPAGIYIV